ncbi:MAG: leucine-rich repeat domain-containing protein, partial [Bacteroidales bacterium]|nr:leucine-rich repeat domain-containing protein [Bacteroidales bacterium]
EYQHLLTSSESRNFRTPHGNKAFYNCTGLTSVTIPPTVTSIGGSAFYQCSSLKTVTVPTSVAEIGSECFMYCNSLASVNLSENITTIPAGCFWDCTSLTDITIPSTVTKIDKLAFYHCATLAEINMPKSLTSIGQDAFTDCSNLYKVHVEDLASWCQVTVSTNGPLNGAYLIIDGKRVSNLVVPESVTKIGSYVFNGCKGLTTVYIPYAKTINTSAFKGCPELQAVSLGAVVNKIDNTAFGDCDLLTDIYSASTIPPTITSTTFDGCDKLTTNVYVPQGYVDTYRAAEYWETFLLVNPFDFSNGNGITNIEGSDPELNYYIGYYLVGDHSSWQFLKDYQFITRDGGKTGVMYNVTLSKGQEFKISTDDWQYQFAGFSDIPVNTDFQLESGSNTSNISLASDLTNGTVSFDLSTGVARFSTDGSLVNGGDTPDPETCAEPAAEIVDGCLKFSCDTEGATLSYTIECLDNTAKREVEAGELVSLYGLYSLTVYATKTGYNPSEASYYILFSNPTFGISNIPSVLSSEGESLLIKVDNHTALLTGLPQGVEVVAYDLQGQKLTQGRSVDGECRLSFAPSTSVAIIHAGTQSFKLLIH